MAPDDADTPPPDHLRAAGDRIQTLLDASAAGGVVARERAEELVRSVTDLYGAGLQRILAVLRESGRMDEALIGRLVDDDLVASLLLVHGLHPHDVSTRVEAALESVRPYLGSHGGDVELVGVSDEGVVRLRLLGSCDGCPSSSVTLKLAVEEAVQGAAPETTSIEVDTDTADAGAGALIPVDSLRLRLTEPDPLEEAVWHPVPELADLSPGELAGFAVADLSVFACRVGRDVLVFLDRCGRCGQSFAGASLARRLGGAADAPLLRCPTCHTHYDVRRAGVSVDADDTGTAGDPPPHLDPLPLLVRDGVLQVAVPVPVPS
jgi:Fe-S cluster biogenesis protein NfuA/nitrite reductase/ring-hydroxylating ferredoxin subunit